MSSPEVIPHLKDLNPPQREAAAHVEGPILILAGAGSGKTRVLTHRVANLVLAENVRPANIIAVTFTNKATNEMRERLRTLLGERATDLWIATFHSSALRILRGHATKLGYRSNFVVYDDDDTKSALKLIIKELSIDDKKHPLASFRRMIDSAKNNLISPEQFALDNKDYVGSMNAEVYDRYQKALFDANAMDFGDLLVNAVRLFKKSPETLAYYRSLFRFILVDEFQDTNKVQYTWLRMLAEPKRNLFVVGDDDQSIYAFRGANIENILSFERDFPETRVVKLEQNYRSTGAILDIAHAVIEKNKGRKDKRLWTAADFGSPALSFVGDDETEEAVYIAKEIASLSESGIPFEDIAIFYRTNAQSRALEEALMDHSIPYRIYGGLKFYDRKEVKDIIAYLRMIVNPDDNQAFLRIVNTPPRGIGAQALKKTADIARDEKTSFWNAAQVVAEKHKHMAAFTKLIQKLQKLAPETALSELIAVTVSDSGYEKRLKESKDISAVSRLENLQELQSIGMSMEKSGESPLEILSLFLDRVSLTSGGDIPSEQSEVDSEQDSERTPGMVSLMTLHLAKGLEYDIVFLTGIEEGLLPHYRSLDDPVGVEEERRLAYVGITRAMKQLYLSRARVRGMFSAGGGGASGRYREPSRFIYDIPDRLLESRGGDFYSASLWEDNSDSWLEEDDFDSASWDVPFDDGEGPAYGSKAFLRSRKKKTEKPNLAHLIKTADDL